MSGSPYNAKFQREATKLEAALGLPPGYKTFTPFPFGGMNQHDSTYAIPDNEFFWLENFMKIGAGKLRSLWDVAGTPIYTATLPATIVSFFFYNIGPTNYCVVFLSDGTADQVNTSTLVVTHLTTTPGLFYAGAGTTLPACAQWGTQYLLISNNNTPNDYWIWDGTLLFQTGTIGPVITVVGSGSGYNSAPTLTFYGGAGSGVTATAVLDNGSIANLNVTNPGTGYGIDDVPQVAIQGGGTDDGAILQAVIAAGTVKAVSVTTQGHGYTSGATVAFSGGGGTGAAATASVSSGHVVKITVTAPGSGYTSAPTVVINPVVGGVGAAAFATIEGGNITGVTVVDGGTGYILPPQLTFRGGGGSGATAIAKLTGTAVAFLRVTAGGQNYANNNLLPNIIVNNVGTGGSGLTTGTPIINNGVLIAIPITNGGSGYTLPPTISIGANSSNGTGAAAEAVLVGTPIASVVMNNQGSGYTSIPAVDIAPGSNNAAYATLELMPFGVSGTALETFEQRVWLVHNKAKDPADPPSGGNMTVSATGSLTDFNPGDGAVLFVDTQSLLRSQYNAIRQSNGYLYPIGDSSIDIISNVATSGTPPITTFNYQNTDPQTGTAFRDTVQPFGRTILLANEQGVYGLYGGAVTRVSEKIDEIFEAAVFPENSGLTPSAALAHLFSNRRVYLLLLTVTDPFLDTSRNVLLGWDEKEWFVASQSYAMTFIANQIINSKLAAFATDGATIKQLFAAPSATLAKLAVTKQYTGQAITTKKLVHNYLLQGEDKSTDASGVTVSAILNTEQGNFATIATADLTNPKVFTSKLPDVRASFLGLTIGSTSPDFIIHNLLIGYTDDIGQIGADELNAPPVVITDETPVVD